MWAWADLFAFVQNVRAQAGIEAKNSVTAVAGNDVSITGSTLNAGGDIALQAGRNMTVGTVTEEFHLGDGVHSREDRVTHTGSAVAAGGNLTMTAANDMTVAGSQVVAGGNAVLAAGKSLSVVSVQDTFSSFVKTKSGNGGLFSSSSKKTVTQDYRTNKASTVGAGGNLTLAAGNKVDISSRADVLVKGSQLQAGKTADITATGSVVFQAAQNSVFTSVSKSSSSLFSSSAKKQASGNVTQVASSLLADNISVQAGDNIRLTASNFFAGKDIALSTTRGDVSLDAAQNSSFSMSQSKSSSVGLFGTTDGFNFFEAKSKMAEGGNRTNVGSALVAGKDISIVSGQDVNARGSLVSAGNNVSINAARDVNMLPGSSSSYAKESSSKSSAGISYSFTSEGYSERVGFNNVMTGSRQAASTNMGNLVTAGNDVSIVSTRDINQVASHVEAKRDVTIAAGRDWNMLAAADTQEFSAWRKEWQAGVTLALKQNVSQAVNAVSNIPAAAGNAQGGGMFTGISAASAGLQAVSSVYNAIFQVVSASVTLGASASEQKASSSSSTAAPSTALAGHDLTASAGQDITIQGGRVQAGNNLTFDAKRDLNIVAATNSYNFSQTASSISGGITGSIGFGASGLAASGSLSASASGSNNRGDGISYTNALVTAGNNLNTTSGRDTNVKGAHVQGNTVDINVGRDLNLQSLQDKAQNSGSSWALGGSIGFDITGMLPGKIAGMPVHDASGPSASIGGGTSSGSMAWVNGQTSITGKEKVNIYTEKNTDLKGAVLAADNGNLLLNTGTLTHSDIQDKNKQQNISANISSGGQLGNSSLSGSYSKTDQEQINRATVGQGTIIIRSDSSKGAEGLNRDLAKAQEIIKNDKVNVTVYLDSQSIKEVASGFSGTLEGIKKLGENLQQMVREIRAITALLPDSLKQLGENRLDLIKNMIRGGSSEDAILTLLKDEKYLELLESDRYASITAMKAGEYGVTFGAERDLSKLVEYGIDTLSKAYEYLNGLENKELIEAAIIGFQVASGGPLAVFKSMLASVATGYLTREIAENIVLGNMYGGRSIDETYDFLYETHTGSTLSKELEKLNNRLGGVQLGFDIVAGIGINAIAGGIKTTLKDVNSGNILPIAMQTVPGRVQHRINLENDAMDHVIKRHINMTSNASKFSISELELRNLLASEEVVSAPIVKYANNSDGISYIREVNIGVNIGFDKFNGNKPTSVLTVFTDRFGNLLTSFPGIQK